MCSACDAELAFGTFCCEVNWLFGIFFPVIFFSGDLLRSDLWWRNGSHETTFIQEIYAIIVHHPFILKVACLAKLPRAVTIHLLIV